MLRTGESRFVPGGAVEVGEGFDDAFNDDRLPRKYHDLIKYYFGDAGEVTEVVEYDAEQATESGDGAASPEPPAEEDSGSEE